MRREAGTMKCDPRMFVPWQKGLGKPWGFCQGDKVDSSTSYKINEYRRARVYFFPWL